jgi:N-methylhydantoinase B/oxoprolinase/acetone carboxylase alpha subunit
MDYAERRTRAALAALSVGGLRATDWLEGDGVTDDDLAIVVRLDVRDGVLHADFAGTAPAARGNVNCPLGVARSRCYSVIPHAPGDDVPMNGGWSAVRSRPRRDAWTPMAQRRRRGTSRRRSGHRHGVPALAAARRPGAGQGR